MNYNLYYKLIRVGAKYVTELIIVYYTYNTFYRIFLWVFMFLFIFMKILDNYYLCAIFMISITIVNFVEQFF